MAYKFYLAPAAVREEIEAYNYYEDIRPGLGEELLAVLRATYLKIAENPQFNSYLGTSNMLRDIKIVRFPYVIVYSIEENEVAILSVRNTSRKPYLH